MFRIRRIHLQGVRIIATGGAAALDAPAPIRALDPIAAGGRGVAVRVRALVRPLDREIPLQRLAVLLERASPRNVGTSVRPSRAGDRADTRTLLFHAIFRHIVASLGHQGHVFDPNPLRICSFTNLIVRQKLVYRLERIVNIVGVVTA